MVCGLWEVVGPYSCVRGVDEVEGTCECVMVLVCMFG